MVLLLPKYRSDGDWVFVIAVGQRLAGAMVGACVRRPSNNDHARVGFPEVELMEDVLLSKILRHQGLRPCVLAGPVKISARRWMKKGIIRQTLSNWWLLLQLRLGAKPNQLAKHYRRHDG